MTRRSQQFANVDKAFVQFAGLTVGSQLRLGSANWTITGIFEDRGSVAESEMWTDVTVLQGAYNRGTSYQSMRVKLTSSFNGTMAPLSARTKMWRMSSGDSRKSASDERLTR